MRIGYTVSRVALPLIGVAGIAMASEAAMSDKTGCRSHLWDSSSSLIREETVESGFVTRLKELAPAHISHRGGCRRWPEHTMLAYERAVVETGTDVLEIDVQVTADGALVIMHDVSVDETTDGTGLVKDMTLEEIKTLDAGYWFTTDGGVTYPYRGTGLEVPTLEEVFEATDEPGEFFGATPLVNIEVKMSGLHVEQKVAEMIVQYGMGERVCVGSFIDASAQKMDALLGGAVCVWYPSVAGACLARDAMGPRDATRCEDYDVLESPEEVLLLPETGQDLLDGVHALGVPVFAWTVNDRDDMVQLLVSGVDGIMTDDPHLLREVMDELELSRVER